jgi:dipeptidyl aminopeptidase/acylaminoacyl peptidase
VARVANAAIVAGLLFVVPYGPASDVAATGLSPVSIADTLAFREITQVQIKPDGAAIAFVSRKALYGTRDNEDTVMVVPVGGGPPRSLLSGGEIELKSWDETGRHLFALRKRGSLAELVEINAVCGESRTLWQTSQSVESIAAAPNGRLWIVAVRVARADKALDAADEGLVYEYGEHSFAALELQHSTQWIDLLAIDSVSGKTRRVARLPYEGIDHPARNYVEDIAIAPDSLKAALILSRIGEPARGGPPGNMDVAIVDLRDGRMETPIAGSIFTEIGATWLGGSDRLFFFSDAEARIYATESRSMQRLPWAKLPSPFAAAFTGRYDRKSNSVTFLQSQRLATVSLNAKAIHFEPGIPEDASYAADNKTYAFISESVDARPAVAVRNVRTGATRRLVDLNAYLDERALGRVEKVTFTNAYGAQSVGYLIYPVDYRAQRRYPLLLATYGFRGRFLLAAEWHTSFPAQTLAGEGYAVLLLNLPSGVQSAQQLAGNPAQARHNEGWQVLSAFESAVQTLVDKGIADPEKLGLYGWSHGAFVVQFMLAHSRLNFSAACLGEGGDYNPGEYWYSGGKSWPAIMGNLYGGPLTAKTAAAYLEFAPSLNVDKVNTPLLMEYANLRNANFGAEFYVPLRELGVPAELVAYDNEEHNFKRPTVRAASMRRKLEWFNYWILDKEDRDPAKAEQYARWRRMKTDR